MPRARKKSKRDPLSKAPLISIISPFRDNVAQVEACVKSLKNLEYRRIEIILVSDKVKWKDIDKRVKAVYNPKFKGAGEKRNAGVKRATGEILFFLDSDCTVKQGSLATLVSIFRMTDADAISGKTLTPEEGNLLGISTGLEYEDRFDRMGENFVSIAATTCLGMRKAAFESMGGFKDYSKGEATGEDWDFSKRFSNAGFKIFHTNKVLVYHHHTNDSMKKYLQRAFQHTKYRITHRRRYGQVFESYFSLPMFVESTILFGVPIALRMYKKRGRWQVLTLPLFVAARNLAWFAGMVSGLLDDKR